MGTFMFNKLNVNDLDVIQNPFPKGSRIENPPVAKVNSLYPGSNCVVHDDTFDWGGDSDIMPADESDNNSSNGNAPYFPYDGKH